MNGSVIMYGTLHVLHLIRQLGTCTPSIVTYRLLSAFV